MLPDLATAAPSDERWPGLDHVVWGCTVRDPDNTALELFAPPG